MQWIKFKSTISFLPVCLVLLFLLPVVALWIYYADSSSLHRHYNQTQAHIFSPPMPMSGLVYHRADGRRVPNDAFMGHWTLLMMNPGLCDLHCHEGLDDMSRIQVSLAAHGRTFQQAVLSYPNVKNNSHLSKTIDTQYPGVQIFLVKSDKYRTLIKGAHLHPDKAMHQGALYVLDPKGQVRLFYRADSDPANIYRDIDHLLPV